MNAQEALKICRAALEKINSMEDVRVIQAIAFNAYASTERVDSSAKEETVQKISGGVV